VGPFARNGLSLACNGCPFRSLHSRVNGTGLLLRSLTTSFAARSALLLRYRFRFAPVPAASSLLARYSSACRFHLPRLRPPLPFGAFTPLRIKAFSRSRCQSVRLPNPPDSLSLPAAGPFSITAADHRSGVATFPDWSLLARMEATAGFSFSLSAARTHRLAHALRGGVVFAVGRPIPGAAQALRGAHSSFRTSRWLAATASARRPGAARGEPGGMLSAAANPPRLIGWGSEPGVPEPLTPSVARRIAERRGFHRHRLLRGSSTSCAGLPLACLSAGRRSSSAPEPIPAPACLGRATALGPRTPLVGLPSGLSAEPGCARSLRSSLALPSHPSRGSSRPRRCLPAGALRSATPRARRAPCGAHRVSGQDASPRRVQRSTYPTSTRCESSEFPSPSRGEGVALDGASPASASLSHSPPRGQSVGRLSPDDLPSGRNRVARGSYRRLLREAASRAPRGRCCRPLRG